MKPKNIKFTAGTWLADAIASAIEQAYDRPVQFEFNGIVVVVQPGDTLQVVSDRYDADRRAKSEAWERSPEAHDNRRRRAAELARLQRMMDDCIADAFDDSMEIGKGGEAAVRWLSRLAESGDNSGVQWDRTALLQRMTAMGYVSGANVGEAFVSTDPENVARYIGGQVMTYIEKYGAIHQITMTFCERWLRAFTGPKPVGCIHKAHEMERQSRR